MLVLAAQANANGVTARIMQQGFGNAGLVGLSVDFDWDGTPDLSDPGSIYAGEFRFLFDASDPDSSPLAADLLTSPFMAFCSELEQPAVEDQWMTYQIAPIEQSPVGGTRLISSDKANDLRELFGKHRSDVTDAFSGEAFSACLWEIIYENPVNAYDLTAGALQISQLDGNAPTLAAAWLADILGDVAEYDFGLFALTNDQAQDFALASTNWQGSPQPIPEPLTMLTLMGSLAALGAAVRRRLTA